RSKPGCEACPMNDLCAGLRTGAPARFPVKTRKATRRFERWWLLLLVQGDAVWLQRRPERGIWAGLYAPPVFETETALHEAVGDGAAALQAWEPVSHSLTHRELQLLPRQLCAEARCSPEMPGQWVGLPAAMALGLPAPVRTLLHAL